MESCSHPLFLCRPPWMNLLPITTKKTSKEDIFASFLWYALCAREIFFLYFLNYHCVFNIAAGHCKNNGVILPPCVSLKKTFKIFFSNKILVLLQYCFRVLCF